MKVWKVFAGSANLGARARIPIGVTKVPVTTVRAGNLDCTLGTGMKNPIEPCRRHGRAWKVFLSVLAFGYRCAWSCRQRFSCRPPRSVGVPVLSVGNLSVGGTGRSLVVHALARYLVLRGKKPAIVLRGYGAAPGPRPLRVSTGPSTGIGARQVGDEAVEHAQT